MNFPICATCGTQYETEHGNPDHCPVCTDDRQYVGWNGQAWTTMEDLARRHTIRMEDDAGVLGLGTDPAFAINQRAFILETRHARVMWECIGLVTDEAVAKLKAMGGVDAIAISHPHFYSAMAAWSEALGNVPIFIHGADREWIGRASPNTRLWTGDERQIAPGVTLIRCKGHFPGSAALHWQDENRPNGALFPGDALQVTADRRHVTFMYSYPNSIPLHPDAVRSMRTRLAGYAFEDLYGYTWGRNIIGNARQAVDHSFDRYLRAVGAERNAA